MLKSVLLNTRSRRQKWRASPFFKKCIEFIRLHIVFKVAAFKYKLENILAGMVARLPLIGPLIAKAFIKPIRDMYAGFAIRNRYISALVAAKRTELDENFEGTLTF